MWEGPGIGLVSVSVSPRLGLKNKRLGLVSVSHHKISFTSLRLDTKAPKKFSHIYILHLHDSPTLPTAIPLFQVQVLGPFAGSLVGLEPGFASTRRHM